MREGDWQAAQNYFARGLSYSTSNQERAHVNRAWGDAARRAGELDIAAEKYRAALAANANQIDAWLGLGRVYLEQNQFDAARDAFQRALALDSHSYPALFFLAEYYEQRGEVELAQQYYARAAEIIPELITPP
jgi:Tfp pilus assembly protein PilF